uniref:Uncharacterized protein n=1 Tax=Zea mays TaxID=4577 RepID=A0A804RIU0_MAIZE
MLMVMGVMWDCWIPNAKLEAKPTSRRSRSKGNHITVRSLHNHDYLGYAFEEIVIGSKTIRLSRWPFTRLFADPAKFCQEKSSTEKDMSPSLTVTVCFH